jgi:sirohydrochlorin ferrochelatase
MIIRHDLPDADSLVDERDWPGVITFFDGDGAGSLVAPTWILTAAHTARNIPSAHEVVIAGERYQVARVVLHPRVATARRSSRRSTWRLWSWRGRCTG